MASFLSVTTLKPQYRIAGAALAAMLVSVPCSAVAQCCGDCNGDGEVTVNELVSAVNRSLTQCADDGICAQTGGQRFPASGQTTSYGPGSDGNVRAGAALSYTDNGDGTITDHNTGLMWEKKDHSGGVHDTDNTYTWGMVGPPYTMNGTIATDFLATLNKAPCFAGHCDWRVPNVKELQSILNYEIPFDGSTPFVAPIFNSNCSPGCSGTRCSCTGSDSGNASPYWSSTTTRDVPENAWVVWFRSGYVTDDAEKDYFASVRAVRGAR